MIVHYKRWYSNGAEQHNIIYNGKFGIDLIDTIAEGGLQALEDEITSLDGGRHCSKL